MVEDYIKYIEEVSKQTGFIKETLEKVERLLCILKWLNNDDELSKILALKGGTAINTAILDFPRLSVDIDLDFTMNLLKDEMIVKRKEIHNQFVKYLNANGYKINEKKSKDVYALDSIAAEYINIGGNIDNIKIEINYMNRTHILETNILSISNKVFKDKQLKILCVHPIEVYAAKICALLSRTTARDLFDVYMLSQSNLFDENEKKLLKQCFMLEYIAINDYKLEDMNINKLDNLKNRDIRLRLVPTLNDRNPRKWNIEVMKEEASKYLKDIIYVDEKTLEFYNKFQNGIFEPELLFADDEILKRVKNHPMIMWKLSSKKE